MATAGILICLILGFLFCTYGWNIRMVGSGTPFYLVWVTGGVLCFAHAVAWRHGLWEIVPFALRMVSFVVFGVCLLLFLAVEAKILHHFNEQGEEDLDYLIVLGAQVFSYGPSVVLRYRLDRAAAYLRENPRTVCIVTGGQGYNEPCPEAQIMREYLAAQGIDEKRILEENRSVNTTQNICNSVELLAQEGVDLKSRRVGIVTNNFHVYRGVLIAKKQGFTHVRGLAASLRLYYLPNNMLREFFGVCKDKLI